MMIMKFSLKLKPSELDEDELSVPLAILAVIAVSGIMATVFVAPGVTQIFKYFKKKKPLFPSHINNCLNRLIRNGLILKDKDGELKLSSKGELRLFKFQEETKRLKKKWDGKWRIVIFDIWEKSRKKRDFLRHELAEFGFIKLQNSVWITPYDCEDYINLLKTDVGLGRGVIYIVADKIDDELKYRKFFSLD